MLFFKDQLAEVDLKLLVLTVDILTSLALSIIANVEGVNGTRSIKTVTAFASLGIFGTVTLVYIGIIVVYYSYKFKQFCIPLSHESTTKYEKIKSCLKTYGNGILIALGGLFYFFGDNFSPLFTKYAEEYHCDQDCIYWTQTAGIVVLGLATVTYLPVLIDPCVPNTEQSKGIPGTLLLVPKITNLDLVYTAIERVAPKDCDKVMIGSWTYWGTYIFVFTVTSVIQSYVSHKKEVPQQHTEAEVTDDKRAPLLGSRTRERSRSKQICYAISPIIPGVFISLFAASYILADNRLPLACTGFAKDISSRNKVWVGLWAFAFVNLAVFCVYYMCKRWYVCKRCWCMCEKW